MEALLGAVVAVANGVSRDDGVTVEYSVAPVPVGDEGGQPFTIEGHESRLGQVTNNLIDNARSFSPKGGTVRVGLRQRRCEAGDEDGPLGIEITVEDEGPGIPDHALERIFERFYTDRPEQGFGQNSGLGLSISRQIIEALGGRIWAVNRIAADGSVAGARFAAWLPYGR